MDLARSHFRMGWVAEPASHLAHYFGASDFGHRGQSAPDLAKKSVSFGFLDRPQLDPSSSLDDTHQVHSRTRGTECRKKAREGIVLLKNERHILPLDRNKIRSIAVASRFSVFAGKVRSKSPDSPKCAKVGFLDKILCVLVMLDNPAHCISRSG